MMDDEGDVRSRMSCVGGSAHWASAPQSVLGILESPDPQRAARIGDFYAGPWLMPLAELLMDIEVDKGVRSIVITELPQLEREDPA